VKIKHIIAIDVIRALAESLGKCILEYGVVSLTLVLAAVGYKALGAPLINLYNLRAITT